MLELEAQYPGKSTNTHQNIRSASACGTLVDANTKVEDAKTVRDLIPTPIPTPVTNSNSVIHKLGWPSISKLASAVSMTWLNVYSHWSLIENEVFYSLFKSGLQPPIFTRNSYIVIKT